MIYCIISMFRGKRGLSLSKAVGFDKLNQSMSPRFIEKIRFTR